MKRALSIVVPVVAVVLVAGPARADQATDESAIWQLKTATLIHRDRSHNVLLRALRQLQDPKLEPLFSKLVQEEHPDMQIHGILALGEIDPKHRINLALVADLKSTRTQAQAVSLALESDLLDVDQSKQLMSWPELDPAVKLIVAAKMVSKGETVDAKLLDDALAGQAAKLDADPLSREANLAIYGMAAMLKAQQGDARGAEALDRISKSQRPERDVIRAMLLQTSLQYDLASMGPWAARVLGENPDAQGLMFLSLRAAVKFKQPGASERFVEQYRAADSIADRIRLAVLALELSGSLEPAFYDMMIQDAEPIIQYMGRTAKALAQGDDATELMLKLVEQNHLLASKWVLGRAEKMEPDKAKAVYVGLILAAEAEPNDPRFRGQRIENAVYATEALAEKAAADDPLIGRLFKQAPKLTAEAMLMGLIRSKSEHAHTLLGKVDAWPSDTAAALGLLLRAKHGVKLNAQELDALGLLVRGGSRLETPLRIQAAWVYGKQTGQEKVYLASVLGK